MGTLLMILSTITAILLIVIVLLQNSKGGGLDSSFGNVNQLGGVAQSTETIEKATWTLAIAMFVLALGSRFVYTQTVEEQNAFLERVAESATISEPAPAAGVTSPQVTEEAPASAETATEGQDAALPE